jgi:hypothetical protein
MTKEGEAKSNKNQREEVGLWVYLVFFLGLMAISISVSLSGLSSIQELTLTQISSSIFFSLLGVIFLMCWMSIPPETEESKQRRREEAEKRRQAELARFRKAEEARQAAI